MFLFTTVLDLLQWKIVGEKAMDCSIAVYLVRLGTWLLTGMFSGTGGLQREVAGLRSLTELRSLAKDRKGRGQFGDGLSI